MSEPMRFSLKHHGQLSCVEHCSEGDYVLYSDYARLKAEVERLNVVIGLEQKTIRNLQQTPEWSEVARLTAYCRDLEARVERLTERNKFLEQIDSYLQDANQHSFEQRCNELEAEVERLRKAGDWMCGLLQFDFVTKEWNAAKEGEPSV